MELLQTRTKYVYCSVCNTDFSCANGGRFDMLVNYTLGQNYAFVVLGLIGRSECGIIVQARHYQKFNNSAGWKKFYINSTSIYETFQHLGNTSNCKPGFAKNKQFPNLI